MSAAVKKLPCGRMTCDGCAVTTRCLNKAAWWRPVPRFVWGGGLALGVGTAALNSVGLASTDEVLRRFGGEGSRIVGRDLDPNDTETVQADARWLSVAQQMFQGVGVRNPERVRLVATVEKGPTAIGINDGLTPAVVYIPQRMLDAADTLGYFELTEVLENGDRVMVYSGPARNFSDEQRSRFVKETGMLFPTHEELRFVLAHEGGHIAASHGLWSSFTGVTALVAATLGLKIWNQGVHSIQEVAGTTRWSRFVKRLPSTRVAMFPALALVLAYPIATYFGWAVERQADSLAAKTSAEAAAVATHLTEKKISQNQFASEHGSWWITSRGNDISELNHFPLTTQLKYFKKWSSEQEQKSSS